MEFAQEITAERSNCVLSRKANIYVMECSSNDDHPSRGAMSIYPANDPPWAPRYELLDGLRGLAALAVVLQHIGVANVGHFAVMVFFVISGYCITASAESCRRNGGGFGDFMSRRVKRIYPPYLLAIAFFALTRAVRAAVDPNNDFQRPVLSWVQNLTLTQWVSDLFHPVPWPVQNPTLFVPAFWSLNYEEQFYLVMGISLLAAMSLRVPMIISVLFLGFIGLIWNWLIPGNWICGLFIEYWAHFALGSCLFFVLCQYANLRYRQLFVAFLLCLGLACLSRVMLRTPNALDDLRAMIELVFLAVVTLALFFLRPLSQRISASLPWRPVAALGTISYSLYLVHQFNLHMVASMARHLMPAGSPPVLSLIVIVSLHVLLATTFWYVCERPFLRRKPASRQRMPTVPDEARIA
jgi:peptidoglycan/LPS O-acetylase OafA/YrhL